LTITADLKSTTSAQHERVEALLALDAASLTRERYEDVLAGFRALYAPLEASIFRVLEAPDDRAGWRRPDFRAGDRRKLPRLDRDLAALSLGTPPDAPAAALPAVADVPSALGALYVLEGATLGGRVISRHLAGALGVTPESGGAFFDGYGAATGPMWTAYRDQVADYVDRFGGREAVLGAATATFDAFERWFEHWFRRAAPSHATPGARD